MTQVATVDRAVSTGASRPLRHAYPLGDGPDGVVVRPGMVARCGHVRTEDEGVDPGHVGDVPLDPCMVCVDLDRVACREGNDG